MSGNITSLTGAPIAALGEPQQSLVKLLEDLLGRAKSGQLQSFIGTGFCSDGARLSVWSDTHENIYEMLGSIAWLEHEYVERHTDGAAA